MLQPGKTVTLPIDSEIEEGYFLTDGETRVFLHKNEVTSSVELGDEVSVFLYLDHQDRLAATMKSPKITEEKYNWVEVVKVVEKLGAFVDIGLTKDALLSKDQLNNIRRLWPEEGDQVLCVLNVSASGRFFAKPATEDVVQGMITKATRDIYNRNETGRVYRIISDGTFIITDNGYKGFIHYSQRNEEPRLGQKVEGRVIDIKEDGTINVSLLPRKQESISEDAEIIYDYMEGRGGAMPFWDKSDPEDIKERFGMSKAAFKRALGNLIKEKKVYQEEGWTYFTKE